MDDVWVGLSEAARVLGVHPATVRNWADRGHLPSQRTPGGHRRFRLADLENWVNQNRASSAAEAEILVQSAMGKARREIGAGQLNSARWYRELPKEARDAMSGYGRRLMEILQQYFATASPDSLAEAHEMGICYGRTIQAQRVHLAQAIEGFFTFHDFILNAVIQLMDTGRVSTSHNEALRRVNEFTRTIILALVEVYEKG